MTLARTRCEQFCAKNNLTEFCFTRLNQSKYYLNEDHIRMFWNRKQTAKADSFIKRIHQIMFFSASLAGKDKKQVVEALRNGLGIIIQNIEDTEDRTWQDSLNEDIAVSFSLDFNNPFLVSQIHITGYGEIDGLIAFANGLERGIPKSVNFSVEVIEHRTRRTPKLAWTVGKGLLEHPDLEREDFGSKIFLSQRSRNSVAR